MTREVISVRAETSVRELAKILLSHNISGVPVLNEKGTLIGIATESDLIFQNKQVSLPAAVPILDSFLFLDRPEKMKEELTKIAGSTVADICSPQVTTIHPDTTLDTIATLMTEKRLHTLPVVDETGKMVGIVGKKDIIRTILS